VEKASVLHCRYELRILVGGKIGRTFCGQILANKNSSLYQPVPGEHN
jgi:hypothetical protein